MEEFHDRFERLCAVLLDNPDMFAYCYTQVTDIFQEQNGILRFDRSPKFDMARLRAAPAPGRSSPSAHRSRAAHRVLSSRSRPSRGRSA